MFIVFGDVMNYDKICPKHLKLYVRSGRFEYVAHMPFERHRRLINKVVKVRRKKAIKGTLYCCPVKYCRWKRTSDIQEVVFAYGIDKKGRPKGCRHILGY